MNDFKKEMKSLAQSVEQALIKYLPQKDVFPLKLHEAMHYSTLSGGKRLRPIMVMKAAEFFGMPYEKVMPTACGIEMIHTYSLIHDDLPVMDNDDFRRGKPTCHKLYGDALALLAGDALLTHAFATMAKNSQVNGIYSDAVIDVIAKVSLAAGGYGMIGGQTVDIASSGEHISKNTLFYISTHKTGCLISASLWSGARLAEAPKQDLETIRCFGEKIGLVFQIVDDILDIKGTETILGKPVGSDTKNKKNTFVHLFGYDNSVKLVEKLSLEAKELISKYKSNDFFIKLTDFIVKRNY
ncbi:MAG TPA: polyprenyl synthetase family protein [Thermoanaerobacterales bacterium]|nr:polyprenyl synthetase family protein [Thermoanaerobacterales bacterium]